MVEQLLASRVCILVVAGGPGEPTGLDAFLAGKGCLMRRAPGTREALQILAEDRVALVICFHAPPERDAFETCRAIRADPRNDTTAVAACAGAFAAADMVQAIEAGVDALLPDPQSRQTLEGVLALLADRGAPRELERGAAARELAIHAQALSHDLRAPAQKIAGFAQMLLEDVAGQLGADGRHYIERIAASAIRLGDSIEALAELARIHQAGIAPVELDLTALALRIIDSLRAGAPERQCEWLVEPGLRVLGDPGLVTRLLGELLGNAWKFTEPRAVARIQLGRVEVADAAATFFVRDNGVGFDARYAEKLFMPFGRLHGEREFAGLGTGLAFARRIVERHGGGIRAEGAVDRGATIVFSLPRPAMREAGRRELSGPQRGDVPRSPP